jgi:hypothetical protein
MNGGSSRTSTGAARTALAVLLCLAAAASVSCGFSAAKPEVRIIAPSTDPSAGSVTIMVDVTNFELADATGTRNVDGRGRIVFYLDTVVPTYYQHSAAGKAGSYSIESRPSHTWVGVSPGEHTFSVQLVGLDGSPLPAPVIDTLTLLVGPPAGRPDMRITAPERGSFLPPGSVVIELAVSGFHMNAGSMGVVNRTGEGHAIYYLDEDPPTDKGIPAVTETCIVSSELRRLWKSVPEGSHVLSAQLVNNDDTPLDPPAFRSVSIKIAP